MARQQGGVVLLDWRLTGAPVDQQREGQVSAGRQQGGDIPFDWRLTEVLLRTSSAKGRS